LKKSVGKSKGIKVAKDLKSIFEELELVESSIHSSLTLRGYLENPRISFDEKVKTLKNIFKDYISEQAYDFVLLFLRSNSINNLTEVLRNYKRTRDEKGVLELEVKTAIPLSPEEKEALMQRFSTKLGRPLTIRNIIDVNIIGGMVIRAGDIMIDASISSKMDKLIKRLRQG